MMLYVKAITIPAYLISTVLRYMKMCDLNNVMILMMLYVNHIAMVVYYIYSYSYGIAIAIVVSYIYRV